MVKFSIVGILAFFFAVVLSPSKASAESTYIYTCNIDGYIHMDVTTSDGTQMHFATPIRCGPGLMVANGDNMRVIVGRKTEIPTAGQGFLAHLERGGPGAPKRVAVDRRGPVVGTGRTTTIYLHPDRVGPNLGRLLTAVDPKWRDLPAAAAAR